MPIARVPLALDDVQVGAADAGAADLHDDVERAADRGLGHLVDHRLGMEFVQPDGLHGSSSTCFRATNVTNVQSRICLRRVCVQDRLSLSVGVVPVPQHAAADAGIRLDAHPGQPGLPQVQRHRRRRRPGRPVDGSMSSGASSPAGRPSSARRCAQPVKRPRRRQLAQGHREQCRRVRALPRAAAGTPGRCLPSPPCAGSQRAARRSSPTASPSKDRTKPAWAATPLLIASEAKWSSRTTSVRPHARQRATPRRRRRPPSGRRSSARRSRWAAAAGPPRRPSAETAHDATNPSEVIGSSSSGSRTVSSAAEQALTTCRRVHDSHERLMLA